MTLYEDAVTDSVRRAMDEAPGDDEFASLDAFAISVTSFATFGGMNAEAVVQYHGDRAHAPHVPMTRSIDADIWVKALAEDGITSAAHATIYYTVDSRTATYVVTDEPAFLTRQKILDSGQIIFTRT